MKKRSYIYNILEKDKRTIQKITKIFIFLVHQNHKFHLGIFLVLQWKACMHLKYSQGEKKEELELKKNERKLMKKLTDSTDYRSHNQARCTIFSSHHIFFIYFIILQLLCLTNESFIERFITFRFTRTHLGYPEITKI